VRIDAYLTETNEGEIGLGERDCTNEQVDLRHPLNDTWAVFWFLLYPGTYSLCHRPYQGRGRWNRQAQIHLVEPTPQHCSFVSSSGNTSHGFVRCEIPPGQTQQFFDGFVNEPTGKPHYCAADCSECLAEGGRCICHRSSKEHSNTCPSCEACPEEDQEAQRCRCG